jgi:phosphoesterase RecJ-like protein
MGKEVLVYNQDAPPHTYHFLPGVELVGQELKDIERFDAAFLLDCSELERVGEEAKRIGTIPVLINIDHHISNRKFCEIAWIEEKASSTGELIFELAETLKVPITRDIAACIYTAILTDTGSFRYSNTGSKTFLTAAKLVELGANPYDIAELVYERVPVERVRLLSQALKTLSFDWGGRIGSILVTQEMLVEAGAGSEHAENFADFVRSIEGVEAAVYFTELAENRFKISLRSKGRVDVERVAAAFGGGGHRNASACRIDGDLDSIRDRVILKIKSMEKCAS